MSEVQVALSEALTTAVETILRATTKAVPIKLLATFVWVEEASQLVPRIEIEWQKSS
jgi:hypothetical protein